jgi:hypothetical protein
MNFKKTIILTSALIVVSLAAHADGAFDFVDPCIKAHRDFATERSQALAAATTQVGAASAIEAVPDAFRVGWWADIEKNMRLEFDKTVAPVWKASGVTPTDAQFRLWMEANIAQAGGKAVLERTVLLPQYHDWVKKHLEADRTKTVADFNAAADDLNKSCSMGAGQQMLRIALNASVGTVTRNLETAKDEPGFIAKLIAIPTGISVDSMRQHGIAGSDGSEVRKAGRAINDGAIAVGHFLGF